MIIHIHLPDDNDTYALSVVADLLNGGYKITVDLDPIIEADDLTTMLSQAIDRAWEAKPVIDLRTDRERHQAIYDQRIAEAQSALVAVCPTCHVKLYQPCVSTRSGKPYTNFAHIDRIRAAHAVSTEM